MTARLPLPLAQASKEEARSVAGVEPDLPAVAGLRVLVIDDQASNVLLLQRQLQRLGHEVAVAGNGRDALALVDRQVFDLIVCDCAMPVMDGYAFAQALRVRSDSAARLPILGYTAGAHECEIERALAAGMNEILIKPVNMGTLQRAISAVLRERVPMRKS